MTKQFTFALALLLTTITACSAATLPNASNVTDLSRRTVTVVGEGSASAKPDVARASIGVEITTTTVADATKQNNDRMNAVIAKIKSLGVADKDIQTTNYNVSIQRGRSNEITGYRVANTVSLTIRDLDKVGTILDQASQAGANNIYGISFAVDDTTKLQADARAKAMADAQKRADELARLAGATRGDVLVISEVIQSNPVPLFAAAPAALRAADSEPSIEAGELSLRMRVQVVYGIR